MKIKLINFPDRAILLSLIIFSSILSGQAKGDRLVNPQGYFVKLTNLTGPNNFPDRALLGNRKNRELE